MPPAIKLYNNLLYLTLIWMLFMLASSVLWCAVTMQEIHGFWYFKTMGNGYFFIIFSVLKECTVMDYQLCSFNLCNSEKHFRLHFQQQGLNWCLCCRSSHTKPSKRSIKCMKPSGASWTVLISFCLMTELGGFCPHIWENTSMKRKSRSLNFGNSFLHYLF